ncbi:MAG TPA: DUF6141 family protein [Candidatus Hydrogenedens sp.]|nr:DUF6141 family protein [Candidatus Hydrogenedens sp.]HOK09111.1 DUF6141 family protein [Candidatus Hydrogenedens sp.]HOL20527.1 DUF6141 family protein [Candidatus Hydrogenedens sp.]HPP58819.1 DUF6141 family protein [Candidatus Hydrogenedens sp.]
MSIQFEKVKKDVLPPESELLYKEVQKFTQWWLWLIIGGAVLFQIVVIGNAIVTQLIFGQPWGDKPMSDVGLIFFVLWVTFVFSFVIALFLVLRLETCVYLDGIYIRYFPFHYKYRKISWDKLDEIVGKKYHPVIEYGGWGIRWNFRSWAYTVSGNTCVELRKGKYKIVIGTKKLDEILPALDKAQNLYMAQSYMS